MQQHEFRCQQHRLAPNIAVNSAHSATLTEQDRCASLCAAALCGALVFIISSAGVQQLAGIPSCSSCSK
jgi:hypothetical protein